MATVEELLALETQFLNADDYDERVRLATKIYKAVKGDDAIIAYLTPEVYEEARRLYLSEDLMQALILDEEDMSIRDESEVFHYHYDRD